jgi:hypothetical protein
VVFPSDFCGSQIAFCRATTLKRVYPAVGLSPMRATASSTTLMAHHLVGPEQPLKSRGGEDISHLLCKAVFSGVSAHMSICSLGREVARLQQEAN